ncbi:MAG: ABC transporter permease [Candidatus Brocadiaceae bacterium]|nr:ABC transporter permease [Candidatus Brocadiaceae bacterium]
MASSPGNLRALPERVVIRPRGGWPAVNWRELWHGRELLFFLAWRDVKVRYKQTVLGALWAILQPLVSMVVLTLVFRSLLGIDRRLMGTTSEGYPYPVFLFAGLLPWQFFSESLRRSSESVVVSANLVQKVYFPRLVIPLSAVAGAAMDFALSLLVLAGLMVWYGHAPGVGLLAVVPLAVLTAMAATGVGVLISALNAAYRDFRHIVPFLLQVWFYATPLIWSARIVEAPRLRLLIALNPMCGIVEGYRRAILPGWPLDGTLLAVSAASTALLLLVGLRYFRKVEISFADIL